MGRGLREDERRDLGDVTRVDPVDRLVARGNIDPVVLDDILPIGRPKVLGEEAGTKTGVVISPLAQDGDS